MCFKKNWGSAACTPKCAHHVECCREYSRMHRLETVEAPGDVHKALRACIDRLETCRLRKLKYPARKDWG